MLSQAIGDLLPSAVGVALSPVPIIAVILMLATPRARTNGPAFAIGWILGLVVVSVIVVVAAAGASSNSTASDSMDGVKVVLGLVFIVMAGRQWRGRPKAGEEAAMPKWMQTIDTFTPPKALLLGAALSAVNPKNLALTLAASASIAQAGLSAGQSSVAIAIFVVLASLTVAGPVLFYLVAASRASGPLDGVKEFMIEHNAVIMMVVLVVLGAKLLGNGISGLGNG